VLRRDGEVEETEEEGVEFLEAGEVSAQALEAAEQPLDLVAHFVVCAVVPPRLDTVVLGRNQWDYPRTAGSLPSHPL
jgi:hypothetical protein